MSNGPTIKAFKPTDLLREGITGALEHIMNEAAVDRNEREVVRVVHFSKIATAFDMLTDILDGAAPALRPVTAIADQMVERVTGGESALDADEAELLAHYRQAKAVGLRPQLMAPAAVAPTPDITNGVAHRDPQTGLPWTPPAPGAADPALFDAPQGE